MCGGVGVNVIICVRGLGKCVIGEQKTAICTVYHTCREKTVNSIICIYKSGKEIIGGQ